VNQFYLHNTGQTFNGHSGYAGADIDAPEAWDITKGNSDVIIAVLDEGVTSNHPDLPNTRQVRLPGSNFATGGNDPSPSGDSNHGNSCAGIIAASHGNEGVAGIAPNCKIMPVRIPFGYVEVSVYADAITFAKDNGADVLSNSWGFGTTNPNAHPVIVDAVSDATINGRDGKGCVVVFAAGNNGYVAFPSNVEVDGVLTVGASDRYDARANYSPISSTGSWANQIVGIVAPSHRAYSCDIPTETFEVWTIDIPNNPGYNPVKDDDCGTLPVTGSTLPSSGTNYLAYTGYFGGTSAACPQVSGVAALILSVNPSLTQLQVANIIESTARKAGGYTYAETTGISNGTWNSQMGHGVLNACAAVQAAGCQPVNFTNQTVTTNTTVTSCGDINIQNVKVQNGAKLTLDAAGEVNIISDFEVDSGSEVEIK
jgi:subtilisin family serine protease